jgi:thiol-disulfide isomerase/thioredoxin
MKAILLIGLLLFGSHSFAQIDHHFSIEINFKDSEGKKVYLSDTREGGLDETESAHIDSQYISNGKCIFYGKFKDIKYYSLAVDSMANFASFIIDTGRIIIKGRTNDYLRKSLNAFSPQNNWKRIAEKTVDSLQKFREPIIDSLLKYMSRNKVLELKYSRQKDTIDLQTAQFLIFFVKAHPNSYYAFSKLKEIYSYTKNISNLIRANYNSFSDEIKNSDDGKYLYLHLNQPIEDQIGKKIPKFSYLNMENEISELKIQENNYYLIDYWASWCVPCIASLPELRKIQNKFEDKGLKIISISLDLDSVKWKTAIKKFNINWINYRDLNSFNSADAKYFDIHAIPFSLLIDKEGVLIQINPFFESIEEFFKQQSKAKRFGN